MKIQKFEERKKLLLIKPSTETPEILKNIAYIHNRAVFSKVAPKTNLFDQHDLCESILRDKEINLLIQYCKKTPKKDKSKKNKNSNSNNNTIDISNENNNSNTSNNNTNNTININTNNTTNQENTITDRNIKKVLEIGIENTNVSENNDNSQDNEIKANEDTHKLDCTENTIQKKISKDNTKIEEIKNSSPKEYLIIGRQFDGEMLELIEFSIQNFTSITHYTSKKIILEPNCGYYLSLIGIKDDRLKNLLTDIFGQKTQSVSLDNIKYTLTIENITTDKSINNEENDTNDNFDTNHTGGSEINSTSLKISLKKLDQHLSSIGPEMLLKVCRSWYCSYDLYKKSIKRNVEAKVKNVSVNEMLDTVGTVHIEKQDLKDIQLKKRKRYARDENIQNIE
ncbi:hypothetical protein EDEG_01173 [Edhazardia aedis USNM 41457]|uniref:Ribosome production factor 2 homolog n=1 Tax=Edhazardia aedis (strain USNM 41457) TaxID=1003232 RepID=J9DA68_EDHAE|nr:hypothetical protein EDEG_01173 [Edhazardia aedis USNM 41457]|eukprot:EJW04621.1 hypothetical protein EDEG_01173 [Edhazardia aedis USNM 41457]